LSRSPNGWLRRLISPPCAL